MAQNRSIQLAQKHPLLGERRFELKGRRNLRIKGRRYKREFDYVIDLLALSANSARRYKVSWSWLIAAILSPLVAMLVLLLSPVLFQLELGDYRWLVLGTGLMLLLVFLVVFFLTIEREQIYCSCFARVPIVRLLVGNPQRKQFKTFVKELEGAIKTIAEGHDLDQQARRAGELRMLRRLVKMHALDESVYNEAKERIFQLSNKV